jgi:hypothetical protein
VLGCQCLHALRAPADQDRIGHDAVAVGEPDAALLAYRLDRTDQVLVHSHAAGDAMHHDAKFPGAHHLSIVEGGVQNLFTVAQVMRSFRLSS